MAKVSQSAWPDATHLVQAVFPVVFFFLRVSSSRLKTYGRKSLEILASVISCGLPHMVLRSKRHELPYSDL
jgi:hypothetical protein